MCFKGGKSFKYIFRWFYSSNARSSIFRRLWGGSARVFQVCGPAPTWRGNPLDLGKLGSRLHQDHDALPTKETHRQVVIKLMKLIRTSIGVNVWVCFSRQKIICQILLCFLTAIILLQILILRSFEEVIVTIVLLQITRSDARTILLQKCGRIIRRTFSTRKFQVNIDHLKF